jgi:hypothetical protein
MSQQRRIKSTVEKEYLHQLKRAAQEFLDVDLQ